MNRRELIQSAVAAAYGAVGLTKDTELEVVDSDAILLVLHVSRRLTAEDRTCIRRQLNEVQIEVEKTSGVKLPFIILAEGIRLEAIRKGDLECES